MKEELAATWLQGPKAVTQQRFNLVQMTMQPINIRMHDGSRHFASLPQTVMWHGLRDHLEKLNTAVVTEFISDNITEAWIDFTFQNKKFSVNDQFGEYWFFVQDASCPDDILIVVIQHCESLLGNR